MRCVSSFEKKNTRRGPRAEHQSRSRTKTVMLKLCASRPPISFLLRACRLSGGTFVECVLFEFELCLCCSLPAELSSLSHNADANRASVSFPPTSRSIALPLSHTHTTCTLFRLTRFAFVFVSLLLVFPLATSFSYTFARSLLSPFASRKVFVLFGRSSPPPFFVSFLRRRSFGDRSCHSFPRCARFGAFPAIKALPKLAGVKRKEIFPVFCTLQTIVFCPLSVSTQTHS